MPYLTAVVAMAANRVIGRDGKLPWHIPEDLAFFKKTTRGKPVLMGRKTFESLGKPLPNRQNIVVTRDRNWQHEQVGVIHNINNVAELEGEVSVIGGAEIYDALRNQIDEWLVSHIKKSYDGDTYLPEFESDFPHVEIVQEHDEFTVKRYLRS